jgi:HEAT repeat protein
MNEAGPQSTVEELLELIRSGDGGPGISRSLDLLAAHQIEPERQAEVRELLKSLMASPHVFVRKSATEAFCQWASAEDIDELRKILANTDSLYLFAKKKAIATISRLNDATLYPDLIRAISDPPLMMDATTALSEQGAGVEQAILDAFPMVEGPLPKNMLLKILQETGTATSLPFLQKLATSPDFTVRGSAEQAMQAIRARQ